MEHLVVYEVGGTEHTTRVRSLDEAIAVAERVRNTDRTERVELFRLEAVAFEFRPWFRVELAGASDATRVDDGADLAALAAGVPAVEPIVALPEAATEPEPARATAASAPEDVAEPFVVAGRGASAVRAGVGATASELDDLFALTRRGRGEDPEPLPQRRGLFGRNSSED